VVREYRPDSLVRTDSQVVETVSERAPVLAISSSAIYDRASTADAKASGVLEDSGTQSLVSGAQSLSVEGPASVRPGELMAMIPWAPQNKEVSDERESAPLGELSQVHFLTLINPGRDHDFQGRVEIQPVVMTRRIAALEAEAAPAVASSRELRRDRILSNLVLADATGERLRFAQAREVVASALDDDRLYDSVRRVGMGGDRLTLKF
jgi:hypothetical protein